MRGVDFERLKQSITPYQYLRALGWCPRFRGRKWCYGPCPVCQRHRGRETTLSVSNQGPFWHCHRCRKGGDVIALAMHLTGLKYVAACEALCDQMHTTVPRPARRRP